MNTFPFMGLRVARSGVIVGHYFEKGVYKDMSFGELFSYFDKMNTLPKTFVKVPEFQGYCIMGNTIIPDIFLR